MNSSKRRFTAVHLILSLMGAAHPSFARDEEPPDPPDVPRDLTLDDYKTQIDGILPQFDGQILQASDGPNWLAELTVEQIAAAVDDLPAPDQIFQEGPLTEARDVADTKFIKINLNKGRIRWANKDRRFDWLSSPLEAIPMSQAGEMTLTLADALGIPTSEHSQLRVDTVMGRHYGPGGAQPVFERERLTTLYREVNGYPVYGSLLRVAVSNEAEYARLLVRWPQFVLSPGLSLRQRQEVVDLAADEVWEADFGAELEMMIELAYVRYGPEYLPTAVLAFSLTASNDTAGQVVFVPLVDVATDTDMDGVPDAGDNCPDRPNHNQSDGDGDGVGNPCDNCPDVANPAQEDSDADGIGDACMPITGACCLEDGCCETTTELNCIDVAGTYNGDGTECLGDVNNDGIDDACPSPLDLFANFPDCMAGPGASPGPTDPLTPEECLTSYDWDVDGDVDLVDFNYFQSAFAEG
jgi:hypothetical protein